MSRQTTCAVLVGPRASGPWGDPLIQPTHVVRFTENSVPGWQVHSLKGAHSNIASSPRAGTVANLNGSAPIAKELVVIVAAQIVCDQRALEACQAAGILSESDLRFTDEPLPEDVVETCALAVAEAARLWLCILDPSSLLRHDGSIEWLAHEGITSSVLAALPA